MCLPIFRSVHHAISDDHKRIEVKFSRQLRKKRVRACYHSVRLLAMLLFAMLMFLWMVPPQSLFASAPAPLGVRIARSFYDTHIAGQVLVILAFSTILWPVQRIMQDLFAMYAIARKRAFYRKRAA
ncbi:hypothetical protein [Chitinophaga rhizosphaerae]|uniref:hypothetical protein n=1 Tax=Chitinophaga rhizosphaerae TaxID=1864947 RepID=UPI000F80110F|nr:hypothetical protein [Chitinophaga rhizosphaerae]